jgi:hypothetical protein
MAVVESGQDVTDLLGKAGAGLPVWLNPEKFLTEDFEPEGCISDLRRYVRLPYFSPLSISMIQLFHLSFLVLGSSCDFAS